VSLPAGATGARRVGGGDINEAWRVTLADGREAFVKTRLDVEPEEYAAEARGLRWLAEPGALRTPRVLEVAADRLVLEWVPPGALSTEGAEELGRGLALTHAAGTPAFGDPGPGIVLSGEPINLFKVNRPAQPDTPDPPPRRSARCGSRTIPPPTGPPSTPSGACCRSRESLPPAVPSPPPARVRSRRCVYAYRRSPARSSRRRGCTAICGAATCWPTPRAGRG
jgi:hypothetical protein